MTVLLIAAYNITDPDRFAEYSPRSLPVIAATVAKHGGKFAFAAAPQMLAGEAREQLVRTHRDRGVSEPEWQHFSRCSVWSLWEAPRTQPVAGGWPEIRVDTFMSVVIAACECEAPRILPSKRLIDAVWQRSACLVTLPKLGPDRCAQCRRHTGESICLWSADNLVASGIFARQKAIFRDIRDGDPSGALRQKCDGQMAIRVRNVHCSGFVPRS